MKKIILTMLVAFAATLSVQAQQIAVVSTDGSTAFYRTLKTAIEDAGPGSVIYLPGGGFPIDDDVIITKKLNIFGIGHKAKGVNADGYTTISGNLHFGQGSDGSAIEGCYISGTVNIAETSKDYPVTDITIRKCNLDKVAVHDKDCQDITVNQNYIRSTSTFAYSRATITNNVLRAVQYLNGATICNNIFIGGVYTSRSGYANGNYAFLDVKSSSINDNVSFVPMRFESTTTNDNCQADGNMVHDDSFGDNCIWVGYAEWSSIFKNPAGITPNSNFHYQEEYLQHETKCGLYGGTDFDDDALPPTPYVIQKKIDTKTDAAGMLNIHIRVKASETIE